METYGFALKSPASLLATDRMAGGNLGLNHYLIKDPENLGGDHVG